MQIKPSNSRYKLETKETTFLNSKIDLILNFMRERKRRMPQLREKR